MTHNRLGKGSWRVVTARAAPLLGRLEDRCTGRRRVLPRRTAFVDDRVKRGGQPRGACCRLDRFGDAHGKLAAIGLLLEVPEAILAFRHGEFVEINEHWCAVVLAGPD